jgi:hypothetical protein
MVRWLREALIALSQAHKRAPSLGITDAARSQLSAELQSITGFHPVAALLWAAEPPAPPRWRVAIYDRATRPAGRVFAVRGIPFIFLHERAFAQLNQATLDYSDGQYVVTLAAA